MVGIYLVIATLVFIVLGLVTELRLKGHEETDWIKLFLVSVAWPLTLLIIVIMALAFVISWAAKTIKGTL